MSSRRAARVAAARLPVARLMVDVPLAHLDRPFDYQVPAELDDVITAGSRVRVRFAGRLVDAYVLERIERSDHDGTLAFVERAVGTEPVLTAQTTALFRAVADRWAGNFVDVVRLAVPSRHAAAETQPAHDFAGSTGPAPAVPTPGPPSARSIPGAPPAGAGFSAYRAGRSFLEAVAAGRPARAVWSARPGEQWADLVAEALSTAAAAGRGALAVVPDARDLRRLDRALELRAPVEHVLLSADLGPAERYRRWLAVRRGHIRVVIGTRAAVYAPVGDLGLLVVWDEGDDLHAEPRAPYAHVRDVAVLRSAQTGAALLIGGFARSAEAAQLLESGWAHEIALDRPAIREHAPRVVATGDDIEQARDPAAAAARLPSLAWRAAREALAAGHPVLVQVPRRGYVPALACARDRTPARCPVCSGPLAAAGPNAVAVCRWCGRPAGDWSCSVCGGRRLRASIVGAARTAEELGRAFPGVPVRTSGGDRVLLSVGAAAALVIATPGAEPDVDRAPQATEPGGYGAALLLDGWASLSRPDLRAGEETLRRWMNAAALVRPGGTVVVGADAAIPAVQALVRWDPAGAAARELAERSEVGFPPAVRMAAVTGSPVGVAEALAALQVPEAGQVIGPVRDGPDTERVLVRVPRSEGGRLAAALKTAAAARSARKSAETVRIVLDPVEL